MSDTELVEKLLEDGELSLERFQVLGTDLGAVRCIGICYCRVGEGR